MDLQAPDGEPGRDAGEGRCSDESDTLAAYIAASQADILVDRHTLPGLFTGQPFQAIAIQKHARRMDRAPSFLAEYL